jgi:hypothetical protein
MEYGFTRYGRYAANAIVNFGYETKAGFIFSAQYTHGIASLNNADLGPGIFHRAVGIAIGKYLGKKK